MKKLINIITILLAAFFTYAIVCHQVRNGLNISNLIYESVFYYSLCKVLNYGLKGIFE